MGVTGERNEGCGAIFVEIGAADADEGGLDLDLEVEASGRGDVVEAEVAGAVVAEGTHGEGEKLLLWS